jgi:putative iron-regulated protein
MFRIQPSYRLTGLTAVVLGAALALTACSEDDPTAPAGTFDATPILENVPGNVIFATYADLAARASELRDAAAALQTTTNESNLAAARGAWRAARRPWEQSEAFLFGPVDTQGLDPAIDSWPVNVTDLDAVLSSDDALTVDFVDGLEGTLKGFHTIEYLLFGLDGDRDVDSFTARELDYLAAAAGSLARAADRLASAWDPAAGDFVGQMREAGGSGSLYVSHKAAIQEIVTGMVTIADEVGNGKINDPYASGDPSLEESRFSANSIADFQDNIRSLQHVYEGRYGSSAGPGIQAIVQPRDADLDARIEDAIVAAIDAIGAIPEPFSQAIFDAPEEVEAAQSAVRALQTLLESELVPRIGDL